jgi:hypothetical protein
LKARSLPIQLRRAKQDITGEESVIAHLVTEIQAEAVLAEILPSLRNRPPIDQFREQLDAAVETVWAIHRATTHYRIANEAFRQLRQSAERVKTALQAMEESAVAPEMANFVGLLKLDEMRAALAAVDRLERDLSRLPEVLSGQQKARKGPTARAWYSGFIRDVAKIAEGIGIDVTTGGDRSENPHATPFTRFVFAVEKLLPDGERSQTLAACAKRIDRAIVASEDEIDEAIARKGSSEKGPAAS